MKILLMFFMTFFVLMANDEIILFGTEAKVSPTQIEEVFQKAGYSIQQNRDMNGPFKKQFGKSGFEVYNLLTLYYPKIAMELVVKNPDSGVFAPFSIVIYQKKGDKYLYAGVLSAKAKAKILGLNLPVELLEELERKNINTLKKALKNPKKVELAYKPKPVKKSLLTKFSVEVEEDEALDAKEEIEMVIEDGLKPIGFVMANFNDFNYDLKEAGIDDFIFYDTYSLCKLKVIYTVSKIRPEAGVFAPCTLAIYQKKKENRMNILFPNIYNWISTLNIEDKEALKELQKAQEDMVKVIKSAIE